MDSEKEKKTNHTPRKQQWIAIFLLISLLIHFICIMLFMQHGFRKRAMSWWQSFTQNIPEQQQKDLNRYFKQKREAVAASLAQIAPRNKADLPAKLTAPKSKFGWVMFDDPVRASSSEDAEIPTTLDGDVTYASAPIATEERPVAPEFAKMLPEHTDDQNKESVNSLPKTQVHNTLSLPNTAPEKLMDTNGIQQPLGTAQPISEHTSNADQLTSPSDKTLSPAAADRLQQITAWQEKIDAFQAQDAPSAQSQTRKPSPSLGGRDRIIGGRGGIRVRGAQSQTEKASRNIIALTKGFVEKLDGENGSDMIDRDGDPDKRPSFEELKYLSYEAQLSWCLQSSWKQNFYYRPVAKILEGNVALEFTINDRGELQKCTLVQSSGHTELDDLVMKNMKCASPFPPIPKHFGVTTYSTSRIIRVCANRPGGF